MARDLTPLPRTEEELDELARLTPADIERARVYASEILPSQYAEALNAPERTPTPDADR